MNESQFHSFLESNIGQSHWFKWSEALFLSRWDIHVMPEHPDVVEAIKIVAMRMDLIRNFFNVPIRISSWYRPLSYNTEIGGAKRSSHLFGMAADFNVFDLDADDVRAKLRPHLADYNIRMEQLPGASWVHIDINCTENMSIEKRYFIP